jgi:hypothetical protein
MMEKQQSDMLSTTPATLRPEAYPTTPPTHFAPAARSPSKNAGELIDQTDSSDGLHEVQLIEILEYIVCNTTELVTNNSVPYLYNNVLKLFLEAAQDDLEAARAMASDENYTPALEQDAVIECLARAEAALFETMAKLEDKEVAKWKTATKELDIAKSRLLRTKILLAALSYVC